MIGLRPKPTSQTTAKRNGPKTSPAAASSSLVARNDSQLRSSTARSARSERMLPALLAVERGDPLADLAPQPLAARAVSPRPPAVGAGGAQRVDLRDGGHRAAPARRQRPDQGEHAEADDGADQAGEEDGVHRAAPGPGTADGSGASGAP